MNNVIMIQPLTWLGPGEYAIRKIVCAANKYPLKDGGEVIIPCIRHTGPILSSQLKLLKEAGLIDKTWATPNNQGFVDQYNNWWSREDAYIIAEYSNQINHDRNGHDHELFSEGLY